MTPERRAVVSIGAAGAVLLAVTAVVLVFGIIPLPDFGSLAEQPDPAIPGTVAYVEYDEEPCIFIVPASGGEPQEAWCGRDFVEFPAWTPDGLLVTTDWSGEPTYILIDPATGTQIDRVPVAQAASSPDEGPFPFDLQERWTRADGATLRTEGFRGGESEVIVRIAGDDRTILSVEDAPDDYRFNEAQWSPDGQWVLVSDSAGRLIVVGADGSPPARVLVDGLQEWGPQAAWYIPGNDTYTVDIPGR